MFWKILTILSTVIAALLGLEKTGVFEPVKQQDLPANPPSVEQKVSDAVLSSYLLNRTYDF